MIVIVEFVEWYVTTVWLMAAGIVLVLLWLLLYAVEFAVARWYLGKAEYERIKRGQ